jgi:hypothetical protein
MSIVNIPDNEHECVLEGSKNKNRVYVYCRLCNKAFVTFDKCTEQQETINKLKSKIKELNLCQNFIKKKFTKFEFKPIRNN